SDRASDPGQGRRRLDGAHVPDVHLATSGYSAGGRLRRAGCHQEALQETQVAEARSDGEDRKTVGALSLDRLLVSVAKPGHQDDGKRKKQSTRSAGILPAVARTSCPSRRLLFDSTWFWEGRDFTG